VFVKHKFGQRRHGKTGPQIDDARRVVNQFARDYSETRLHRQIIRLFMGEGIILGLLSWLIAWPLSIPAAYGLATRGWRSACEVKISDPTSSSTSSIATRSEVASATSPMTGGPARKPA
jgi:hypothetical protein